jgi:hypothetical protein
MFKKLFKSKTEKKSKNVTITEEKKPISAAYSVPEEKIRILRGRTVHERQSQSVVELKSKSQSLGNMGQIFQHFATNPNSEIFRRTNDQHLTAEIATSLKKPQKHPGFSDSKESDAKNTFEVAPLRSLDDFLLGSARFDLPTIESWGNRVKSNLLYYQTNYGIVALLIMIIMMMNHPTEFLLGIFLSLSIGLTLTAFKLQGLGILALICFCIPFIFYCCMVFLSSVVISATVILIHATLRPRNIRNKIETTIERIRVKKICNGNNS